MEKSPNRFFFVESVSGNICRRNGIMIANNVTKLGICAKPLSFKEPCHDVTVF